ncbi:hypothetical protein BSL78_18742 [Apostichopus japonicus]|uniref:Uncharacterized protein n=1 Tax=Stichopus japonicus TaxID=307972 RepID=A0A2G8K8S6_STIJA|nr:hypothetical protein BSL78_18742 [Apostichopus japonicus]
MILCSLFPNFSHDVLIDSVTSEVNYIPENQNSTVLLNSCIDDLSNRVPLVDFTGGFTPNLSVITPMETEEVAAGGLTTPRPPEAILTLPSTSCAGGLTTPRPPEANLTLPSTSRNENPPEEESKPGMYQKDAEKTIGHPLKDTHDSISDEEEEHAAVVESGVFTPDLSVITPMETEEVVGGGPTIPRPPEANLTLPSTSRKENPPEEESKPGMYPKEAEKTIGQPLTDTHDSISDEEEEHAAVVESADSEDISDEVIVVADGSDYSSSPPAITIESDSEETSDHIQTNNNDTEEESNRLKETKIETGCPILLGTYRDPMNTPLKQQDQITGSDLGAVSMGIDPDVFSHDSSAGNSGVVSRETQRPAIGVSSSIWHTSEVVGATSSFKSHDCVAETSHMSFNVMVNSSIISGKVVSEMSSATDRNVLSDLTKDGASTSLHGLNKSLVTPILTQTAAHSSTGSILCKEAKELKFDLAKYCDQTFNVKSQKDSASIPNESCVTTHGISGQSQVFHNPPERCSEYKKTGGPKFPPIITVPPKTFHTPSTWKHAAKRFDSSYCRVHHGVKNCNCRSEHGSLSYSSSSLGSSKIDSSVSQPKKRKVEFNEFNNTISESHHHSFLGSSNVYSTHTGLAGTSFNSFPVEKKGKEIGKGKGKEMVAKFNSVSTNTLQGYECSTNRSDMNDKTEDVTVGKKLAILNAFHIPFKVLLQSLMLTDQPERHMVTSYIGMISNCQRRRQSFLRQERVIQLQS